MCARSAPPRSWAAGCDIGGLFVLALGILLATRLLPAALRALAHVRSDRRSVDFSAALLVVATRGLPTRYADWGTAMHNEHRYLDTRSARWRFSLSCTRAAALIRLRTMAGRPAPGTASSRAFVLAGIAGALCLSLYGLLRYPELRSEPGTWVSLTFFLLILAVYALLALALSGKNTRHATIASRHGLSGGLLIGSAWFLVLAPTSLFKPWVAIPLLIVLLGPVCIAALAARSARDARTGTRAALWSGLVGGLAAFLIWVTATYLRDGRPYDLGLVRDFHQSGAHDLATYAVSDNLGSGLVLLLIVPIVALAFGSITARLAAKTTT